MNIQLHKYRHLLYGMTHVLFTVLFCLVVSCFTTILLQGTERNYDDITHAPAILYFAVSNAPYSWGILLLSILLGILLLILKIRSRTAFAAYTAFFVFTVTSWGCFTLIVIYLSLFWNIDDLYSQLNRHRLIDHQRHSPITLTIDEQLAWRASSRVFDYTVRRMGELMKEERPDIAKKFLDSASETHGYPELDMRDFPLTDKEYVLTILTTFRQELAKEKRIEFDKYSFPCCQSPMALFYEVSEKRLAEFEDLLRQSIERLRSCSLEGDEVVLPTINEQLEHNVKNENVETGIGWDRSRFFDAIPCIAKHCMVEYREIFDN